MEALYPGGGDVGNRGSFVKEVPIFFLETMEED